MWDQLSLDSQEFLSSVEGFSFEMMVEQLLMYNKTVYIPLEKIDTTLTPQEQVNLVASSGMTIGIINNVVGTRSFGFLISKNQSECLAWYNILQMASKEAAEHRLQ